MRMMDVASVQRALFQFQIKDYKKLFNDWDPIRNLVVPNKLERATKRHSVTAILNVLKDKRVTKNDIAHLDILYNYYHSRRKVWRVFQFDRIEDEFESVPHTSEDFREKLHVRLSTYFSSEIAVLKIENTYWFRIRVGSNRRRKIPPSITYVVHFPNTRYLVIAGLKSASAKFLLQAFQDTLDCADVEELTLRGRCVSSLAQLAVNKEYRGTGATPPSLTEKIERERSASTMDLDCQIICENKVEHDKRNTLLDDQFGPFVQPALEKVEYKLETKFKGIQYAPAMATSEDLFKCRVKFEGSNVIEGMRELGEAGIAEVPMPKHLRGLSNLGQNFIVLRDRKPLLPSQTSNLS